MADAGWWQDPTGRHELRYFDGNEWTAHVSDQGAPSQDPVTAPPPPVASPPSPTLPAANPTIPTPVAPGPAASHCDAAHSSERGDSLKSPSMQGSNVRVA